MLRKKLTRASTIDGMKWYHVKVVILAVRRTERQEYSEALSVLVVEYWGQARQQKYEVLQRANALL